LSLQDLIFYLLGNAETARESLIRQTLVAAMKRRPCNSKTGKRMTTRDDTKNQSAIIITRSSRTNKEEVEGKSREHARDSSASTETAVRNSQNSQRGTCVHTKRKREKEANFSSHDERDR